MSIVHRLDIPPRHLLCSVTHGMGKSYWSLMIFLGDLTLFWDGPYNFEPRSDDEDDTLEPPSPHFHITPAIGRLATTYDLTCNRSYTRRISSGIGYRIWNPPAQKPRPYH
ncbi:hypothetical protein AVEN_61794-1 [Araneus ventricosus]|uniref:Uncharacterized protein n=1 Tax=Araneus ventricosus TaxID=182803 RepID=A0A4Y2PU63_ARAVE|nr:hypothetical protein AVEN_61794-1 [Araneus ventricosus]